MAQTAARALHNGGLQTGRCAGRLKGSNRSVYRRIWTLHCRKEKDSQNAENSEHSQFASAAASNHWSSYFIRVRLPPPIAGTIALGISTPRPNYLNRLI